MPKIGPPGERYQDSTRSNKHEIIKSIESIKRRLFEPGGRENVITVECDGAKTYFLSSLGLSINPCGTIP